MRTAIKMPLSECWRGWRRENEGRREGWVRRHAGHQESRFHTLTTKSSILIWCHFPGTYHVITLLSFYFDDKPKYELACSCWRPTLTSNPPGLDGFLAMYYSLGTFFPKEFPEFQNIKVGLRHTVSHFPQGLTRDTVPLSFINMPLHCLPAQRSEITHISSPNIFF